MDPLIVTQAECEAILRGTQTCIVRARSPYIPAGSKVSLFLP